MEVRVIGGGPAGSVATLAAARAGATVELVERSRFPRHKVCGEFLSPEIEPVLRRIGVWDAVEAAGPARIDSMLLQVGRTRKSSPLPRQAFGLSRYAFDQILHAAAVNESGPCENPAVIVDATGRDTTGAPPKGERLFGFKAHFEGPQTPTVELYFFDGCYVGLNAVENGRTNVCGLGPEHALEHFDIDALVRRFDPLRERLSPLSRVMDWVFVGPLIFRNKLADVQNSDAWPAGDALSFVDPFTGSGLLSAVVTGELAGRYAAEGRTRDEYQVACRKLLRRPFAFSGLVRHLAGTSVGERLMPWVPASWLFHLTRPA